MSTQLFLIILGGSSLVLFPLGWALVGRVSQRLVEAMARWWALAHYEEFADVHAYLLDAMSSDALSRVLLALFKALGGLVASLWGGIWLALVVHIGKHGWTSVPVPHRLLAVAPMLFSALYLIRGVIGLLRSRARGQPEVTVATASRPVESPQGPQRAEPARGGVSDAWEEVDRAFAAARRDSLAVGHGRTVRLG